MGGRRRFLSPSTGTTLALLSLAALIGSPELARARPQAVKPQLGGALRALLDSSRQCVVQVIAHRPVGACPKTADGLRRSSPLGGTTRLWSTGIVVDDAGRVLTCGDVAQPDDSLEVRLLGGEVRGARFVSQDARSGVTLIQVLDPSGLRSPFGPEALEPLASGEWLVLLPLAGDHAGADFRLARLDSLHSAPDATRSWMRISSASNQGCCGAAVLDGDGGFRGMVVDVDVEQEAGPLRGGCPKSLASALAGERLRAYDRGTLLSLADRLVSSESSSVGYLGVSVVMGTTAIEPHRGEADAASGSVVIDRVLLGSPAEVAGLLPGDELVSISGQMVSSALAVSQLVASFPRGTRLEVGVLRQGAPLVLSVRIGDSSSLVWADRQYSRSYALQKRLEVLLVEQHRYLDLLRGSTPPRY